MKSASTYPPSQAAIDNGAMDNDTYLEMYQHSIQDPDDFWQAQSGLIDWIKPPTQIKNTDFSREGVSIKWFEDGLLNVSHNCLDRHLADNADTIAIHWEPNDPGGDARSFTYQQLHDEVCRCANGLKSLGVDRGDVVTIYMPMIPEAIITILACARIGAPHSVVFAGFSAEALADRIENGHSRFVVTADAGLRGDKQIPLKDCVDVAVQHCHSTEVEAVVMVRHTRCNVTWVNGRDHSYHDLIEDKSTECEPAAMNAEDPLFILYTSGSTGKPKGMVHTQGGYAVYTHLTFKKVFNYQPKDVYWCSADIGWITGHSYAIYGPLSNGATTVIAEGIPNWPTPNRAARIIDKYRVNIFYTAPTAIRAMMADGDAATEACNLSTLKVLGTAGEPINPEAWRWFHETVGQQSAPIMDTWWQTETGGVMLTPLPGATALKPGSATRPFFGIQPALIDASGNVLEGEATGGLVITDSWPSQARTIWGDHKRFTDTYFSTFDNVYFTSDAASRDSDGYYWINGRMDDVLNVAGHRLGTAEIESALISHHAVIEAAVVGVPHDIKGESIYVYVSTNPDYAVTDELAAELKTWIRNEIGAIATPETIQWAVGLPKTRSGKIMRRILRKIATEEFDQLGDTSTLADPSVVDALIEGRQALP
ncbi:Acetyl-coenzyme A synthetase [BD1-7 clade bacterium]|uniref:Acetate--CoA ligase n=1 Tax=BD1-7 clade bacterium TaxID=2029982 RepID=A0A5S9P4Y6_9GAMM|nr:Acetyl-coenzyme A synthetase [BD1-7 clade bacterium]CAA0098486.1 Acetyl-coenzyme A synthetase [BD1-7 clade bacterium]